MATDSNAARSDLAATPRPSLFALYRSILAELKTRGVVRTENAPAGDYAEYLVATAFSGKLAPNSEKSWDVLVPDGTRLQVKARVVSDPPLPGQRQLSPFRSFAFDAAVVVLLAGTDYSVRRAVQVPRSVVRTHASYREHVNGQVLRATDALFAQPGCVDVTERLRWPTVM